MTSATYHLDHNKEDRVNKDDNNSGDESHNKVDGNPGDGAEAPKGLNRGEVHQHQ